MGRTERHAEPQRPSSATDSHNLRNFPKSSRGMIEAVAERAGVSSEHTSGKWCRFSTGWPSFISDVCRNPLATAARVHTRGGRGPSSDACETILYIGRTRAKTRQDKHDVIRGDPEHGNDCETPSLYSRTGFLHFTTSRGV